jgi:Bacterial Ig-like domain (group 2)
MASHADRSHTVPNRLLLPAIAALAVVAACGSTEPKVDVTPATITGTPTDTIRATVGSTVVTPLTVIVKNKAGSPIDSAIVTFAVTGGGGSVTATSVRTDATGTATTSWTLGPTAGIQTATATATGLVSVSYVAIAAPGAPATVSKVAGDAQSAIAGNNVAVAPSVKVVDAFGNVLQNVLVTFAVASGGGSVTGGLANTTSAGIATVGAWKLGNAIGANTLTATVASLPATVFSATAIVGAASQVRITNTAPTLTSGQAFKLTAQALDANNNVIPNAAITWASSNTAIATVDTGGTVTGVGAGNATITATSGTGSANAAISVIGHPAGVIIAGAQMAGLINGIAVTKTTAYAGIFNTSSVVPVDLATATAGTSIPVNGTPTDVGFGGTTIAAVTSSPTAQAVFVNAASGTITQSANLGVTPFRSAITSDGTKMFVDRTDFSLIQIDPVSGNILSNILLPGTVNAMKIAAGDTLMYIGTALGTVFEVDTRTMTIRRQFQPSSSVVDLSVSRDGKTLYSIDGSTDVTMTPLASGGKSGTVTFPQPLFGVAISPDNLNLWASMSGALFNAPFQDGTFQTIFVASFIPIPAGGSPTRIEFSPLGDFLVAVDGATNKVYVLK